MDATVFYAWQSDRPRKVNRDLIHQAAEAACERISEDGSNPWNVTLDSDTQGVAGMCDIPNTILDKISRCSIFLADLTFVGKTDNGSDEQQMPNPNVLFELGFAANCLGFDPLVGVINEAYGSVEGQVFDIKRRSSLSYSVPENATSRVIEKQRDRLSRQLEEVFRTTLEKVVAPRMAEASRDREDGFKRLQSDFADRVKQGRFHDYEGLPATLLTIQTNAGDELDYDDLYRKVRIAGKGVCPGENTMYWTDGHQTVELGINGVLLHAYGGVYPSFKRSWEAREMPAARLQNDGPVPLFLPATNLQMNAVSHALDQCQLLNTLELPFPWLVGISIVGASGFNLITESEQSPRIIDPDDLHFGPCTVVSSDQVADRIAVAGCLRGLLDRLCRTVGWERSPCFTSEGVLNQRFVNW